MPKIDCRYEISEERIRSYLAVPEIDRLRWLEDLIAFTRLFREAPSVEIHPAGSVRCAHEDDGPSAQRTLLEHEDDRPC